MPLPTSVVKPVFVARNLAVQASSSDVADSKLSELEAYANGTLANTIRQLSSLSKQADGMFGELIREAHSLTARVNSMQIRLDRLSTSTKQLHSDDEEVPLRSIHPRKDFKSVVVFDRQVFSRDTMPRQLLEMYSKCDKPPSLYKLDPYREDGQDSMKFYTDPNHFFDLQGLRTSRDVTKLTHDLGGKRNGPPSEGRDGCRRANKMVKRPSSTRERQTRLAVENGEHVMSGEDSRYRETRGLYTPRDGSARQRGHCQGRAGTGPRAEVGPPSIYGQVKSRATDAAGTRGRGSRPNRKRMPPPPPPPSETGARFTGSPPSAAEPGPRRSSWTPANVPPAPPMPSPAQISAARRPSSVQSVPSHVTHLEPLMPPAAYYNAMQPNVDAIIDAVNGTTADIRSGIARKTPETYHFNFHNDLLKAIKDGVELKKVGRDVQKEEDRNDGAFRGLDVILSRRVAIEISDSDSSSSKGYDSDGWVEEVYTLANSSSETPRKS